MTEFDAIQILSMSQGDFDERVEAILVVNRAAYAAGWQAGAEAMRIKILSRVGLPAGIEVIVRGMELPEMEP